MRKMGVRRELGFLPVKNRRRIDWGPAGKWIKIKKIMEKLGSDPD